MKKPGKKLTKRQEEYIRGLRREIAAKCAKKTREYKREQFKAAMAKEKVETFGDVYGIFCGLSRRSMEVAALDRIETMARRGYSPVKIVELMEIKKGAKNHD
jgi:hypothetical protein